MKKEGVIERLKRGVYAIPQDPAKMAKKEMVVKPLMKLE
jgi:predicted transcriptional regulator of viral defense system